MPDSQSLISSTGQVQVASLKDIESWCVENGYVKTPVDFASLADTSYLDYALAQDGKR